jgi:hypothetical protein
LSDRVPDVRIRAASNKKKSLAQYDELRRSAHVAKAVVIAQMQDGTYQVLGQDMNLRDMAQALLVAAHAVTGAAERENRPVAEPHEMPISAEEPRGITMHEREITRNAEGVMVPPEGETIISCGECRHPRWYVCFALADDQPARFACAHCGNEVKLHRIHHGEGRA